MACTFPDGMPKLMVWDSCPEYPGVRIFAQKMKDAILCPHNLILNMRVKQT